VRGDRGERRHQGPGTGAGSSCSRPGQYRIGHRIGRTRQLVRDRIGAVAALRRVDVVAGLPKTRSGKILRKTMRGIADGTDEPVPSTIEDPAVLDALRPLLSGD